MARPRRKPAKPRAPGKAKPAPVAPEPAPPPPPPPPPSDVKVVTSYTRGAQVYQNTTYLTKSRQRFEFPGMVTLEQCDLQRTVMLNPAVKRFRVQETVSATAQTTSTIASGRAGAGRHAHGDIRPGPGILEPDGPTAAARRRRHPDHGIHRHAGAPDLVRSGGPAHPHRYHEAVEPERLRQVADAHRGGRVVRRSAGGRRGLQPAGRRARSAAGNRRMRGSHRSEDRW